MATNPFAGAFGPPITIEQMMQAMGQMQGNVNPQAGMPPGMVNPMNPQAPMGAPPPQGAQPIQPPGPPQLNPEAVAELAALSNRETRGLSDVMDVKTGDPGTALAKALTAHMLRKKQMERDVSEEAP